ncbi:AP-3 complex subunit beta-1-like 1 [Homarus americanus]|uniref:Mediator of RNA polymerase II transcription subunit 24 n=1 Tax=Homarus americanus TaxID=6706 RepID=A0A8J5K352_HOMAM|nr:AP-3 complex subunit beta-1-like 1 [Homarus americanus]
MGPLPNNLMLSYLKHSLSSQIVSYGGVIESISKYDGLHKPHCVHALLTLMQSMMKSVSCRGKPEDCLMLATSIVAGVKWLVQVTGWTTQQLLDLRNAPELSTNLNLAASILTDIFKCPFLICMLEIGRREEPGTWSNCVKKMVEVETLLAGAGAIVENKDLLIITTCQLRDYQPLDSIGIKHIFDSRSVPLCYAMHSLVMLEVMTHTTRDASTFAHQLLLLQQLQGLSTMELYLELLRNSFIGLSCPEHRAYQELKWVGFTFIKVPSILYTIHVIFSGESTSGESEDLLTAVQRLSQLTILLDQVDSRINCNCLEYLLNELVNKTSLISETDAQAIIAVRVQESNVLANIQNNDAQMSHPGSPNLILRAQPTVTSILKTLSNKNQESVLPVMNLLISGKSRDLLLAAAAASGSLHIFAQKFVKFNELSMDPQPGETTKMAINRALMFDISFLLLCHIVQQYGIDVVVSEKCETFVEQWMKENMPELGRVKAPLMSVRTDQNAVEEFIREVNVSELDKKYNMVRWSDVCQVAAVALREVVSASQQGALPVQHVKELLDRLSYHLSTLMVEIAENMVQVMKGGVQAASNTSSSSNRNGSNNPGDSSILSYLFSQEPLSHLLRETWNQVFPGGIITHHALATFKDLLRLGGTRWFVCDLIKVGMQSVFHSDLTRGMDLIYGLLHQNVVGCTLSLLVHALPMHISGSCSGELISKQRTEALARLAVMMIISAWLAVQQPPVKAESATSINLVMGGGGNVSLKRTYHDRELEDLEANLQQHSVDLAIPRGTPGLTKDGTSLLAAVQSLLKLMTQASDKGCIVSQAGVVSPVSQLVVDILHELIAAPYNHTLLTLTPPALLPNLVPLLSSPDAFTYAELLAITAPKPASQPDTAREFVGNFIGAQTPAQAAGARRAAAKLLSPVVIEGRWKYVPRLCEPAILLDPKADISIPLVKDSNERPPTVDVDYAADPASGSFFSTEFKKHEDLKQMLDSNKDGLKLEAMKRIIGMVAKGRDASELFPAVVKNVVSANLEVKKLVYVYLVRYAEEQQDLALLSISTFQRALKDPNQLIRACALRVLSSIRVPVIVPIMMLAIKDAMTDMSPYVRKTAAHAIPKLYNLDPEQKEELIQVIEKLLSDKTTLVVGSAVMAFEEVCPERIDLIHKNYRKLCNLLVDVEEWGQVIIINMLTRYARTQFVDPNAGVSTIVLYKKKSEDDDRERPFYEDDEEIEDDETLAKRPKPMDPDHRLLLRNAKPLLQSRNAAHIAPRTEVSLVARALVRLLRSHREIQAVVLTNIASMSTRRKASGCKGEKESIFVTFSYLHRSLKYLSN